MHIISHFFGVKWYIITLVFYITTPKERTAADTRSLPRRDTAARSPWYYSATSNFP
jgi:hypothetical protein